MKCIMSEYSICVLLIIIKDEVHYEYSILNLCLESSLIKPAPSLCSVAGFFQPFLLLIGQILHFVNLIL